MSGEVRFAFYSAVTGSTLPASSIGSGSIETYHLSESAVTPAKADLAQTWNFTGGLQVNGVAVGASGSTYLADESSLHLSGATFSISASGVTTTHLSDSSVTTGKIANAAVTPDKVMFEATTWDFSSGILRAATPSAASDVVTNAYFTGSLSASLAGAINAAKGAVRTVLVGDDETTGFFLYSSGALTFQGHANLNGFGIGGITDLTPGDRILFSIPASAACFTASGSWSGIYTITNVGAKDPSGSAPVLTRASDFDSTSEITPGSFVFVNSGNPNTDGPEIWYLATSGSVTLDTTPLLFASASFSVTGSGGGSIPNHSITPQQVSSSIVQVSGGLQYDDVQGISVVTSGAIGVASGSVYLQPNSIGNGYIKTDFVYGGGSDALSVDPGGLRLNLNAINPSFLSSSVAGNGLTGGGGQALSVNVDGQTIQITNDTLTLATGSVGGTQLGISAAGNGLLLSGSLQVLVDPVFQNPLVVSVSGTSVREASATQSGYMSTASYTQLASVVSYSSPPVTAGPIGTAVTTSNTQTAGFNIGVVPANTIWTVKFTSFSIDTAEAANLINNIGAFSIYRSGSNNVTQVGATEIEHSFVSGAFTSVTMSLGLAQGQPGNADFVIQGINTYNIKHWAKFQITEFVYA